MANEKTVADVLNANLGRLDEAERQRLRFKVSEKGAVSVYGLGRFPVTLYREQWARLLDVADEIRSFIELNVGRLKTKEKSAQPDG